MYTEKQVLKKLNIPDFYHLVKDKTISFATLLPKMDSEVAKKALEQFPNFSMVALEIVREYQGIVGRLLDDDGEGARVKYAAYERELLACEEILKYDKLTFEQKCYILQRIREIANEVSKEEDKRMVNRIKILGIVTTAVVGVVAIISSVIGNSIAYTQNGTSDSDDEEDDKGDAKCD